MRIFIRLICMMLVLSLLSCSKEPEEETEPAEEPVEHINRGEIMLADEYGSYVSKQTYSLDAGEEHYVYYATSIGGAYRYGPSIMRNGDGSYDAWFSAPGNYYDEWDYITYCHSSDGMNWGSEKTVLWPTRGSADRCSTCDPGLVYFNDYYYLAYTSTDYHAGNGSYNSAFVARSKDPDGPYEKWNGEGWGGSPEPFIKFEGEKSEWGIGEVSFVVLEDKLFIYYTYTDINGSSTHLALSDLSEDWPARLVDYGQACNHNHQDSLDVVYADDLQKFLGFAIEYRLKDVSRLIMYESYDGFSFLESDTTKTNIEDYAHNLGISKDYHGHINASEQQLIGYAYGRYWGRWSAAFQHLDINVTEK